MIKLGPPIEPTVDQTRENQDTKVESSSRSDSSEYVVPDLNNLPADPGRRLKITRYHPNDRDKVRRAYLQKGPCQPGEHNFKK